MDEYKIKLGYCEEAQTYCGEREKAVADGMDIAIDKFAEILSNIPNICGTQCPVKCNWGTEDSCKEMCKKWLAEQLKDK